MNLRVFVTAGLAIATNIFAGTAVAQTASADQVSHGKKLFLYCAACHSLNAGEPDKTGPNLHGILGAVAGKRGTFVYSEGLKGSGIVWSPETLDMWLKQPAAMVPGTKMVFAGLPKPEDRADLVSYLTQATQ